MSNEIRRSTSVRESSTPSVPAGDVQESPRASPATTPSTNVDRSAALRVIDGGRTPQLQLVPPGATARTPSAPTNPTSAARPSPVTTPERTAADILAAAQRVGGYRADALALARLAQTGAGIAVQVGDAVLGAARNVWDVTRRLWENEGVMGKIGAFFTGLAAGILYALGGVLWAVGKLVDLIATPIADALSTDKKDSDKKQKEAETKAAEASQELRRELDELDAADAATQRRVLAALVRTSGLGGTTPLDSNRVSAALALLEACNDRQVQLPGIDSDVVARFPAAQRAQVARLVPATRTTMVASG